MVPSDLSAFSKKDMFAKMEIIVIQEMDLQKVIKSEFLWILINILFSDIKIKSHFWINVQINLLNNLGF